MDLITRMLIGLGLSADAFAVAVTNGICSNRTNKKNVLATAVTFGFFQGLMPLLGFYLGKTFADIICRYQHYVALFLLTAIGINMITDAARERKQPEDICIVRNIYTARNLILQGIATSIDALAVGVSFAAMKVNIITASLLIGVITFFCCFLGVCIGKRFGALLGLRARLVGGILLIVIGLRIFAEKFI